MKPIQTFKLKHYLFVPIMLGFLIFSLIYILFGYKSSTDMILLAEEKLANEKAEKVQLYIEHHFNTVKRLAETNYSLFVSGNLDADNTEQLAQHFAAQLRSTDFLTWISFGRTNGEFVGAARDFEDNTVQIVTALEREGSLFRFFTPNEAGGRGAEIPGERAHFDSRTRPWYRQSIETGRISWYPVFRYVNFDTLGIGVSAPVYNREQQFLGVLTVDFSLHHFSEYLKIHQGKTQGLTYIAEADKTLLTISTDEAVYYSQDSVDKRYNLQNHPNELLQAAFTNFSDNESDHKMSFLVSTGKRYIHHYRQFTAPYDLKLIIGVIIDEKDLAGTARQNLLAMIILLTAIIFITSLIIVRFTKSIIQPVETITKHTQLIAAGSSPGRLQNSTHIREFSQLVTSVNDMDQKINNHVQNLEAAVNSRTKELKESEERYTSLYNDSPAPYLILKDGHFIDCNKAAETLLACPRDEIIGASPTQLSPKYQPSGQLSSEAENDKLDLAFTEGPQHFEWLHRRPNGETFWVKVSVSAINLSKQPVILAMWSNITEQKNAEAELQKQLSENDILLKEVHHRVKNNIASIISLLRMQSRSNASPEAVTALHTAISRVQGIYVLYEKLLLKDAYTEISARDYTESLLDALLDVYTSEKTIYVERQLADFTITPQKAVSIGIIINELLTNIFKYAFQGRKGGKITISLEINEKHVTLKIQDDGIGFDKQNELNSSPGFGLTIVKMLVDQLHGSYNVHIENGTTSIIEFNL